MIITILILILDYVVLSLNDQNALKYHSVYISLLVVRLWHHQQPKSYCITQQRLNQLKKDNDEKSKDKVLNKCFICQQIKPSRYYHCRRCNKCIYRMDHHCNWVGNCIGQYNSKVYLHLLLHVFIHCLALTIVVAFSYNYLFDSSRYEIYYLANFFPGIYGLYESYRLINDFWVSIKLNQTLVQSFKKVAGKKTSFQDNFIANMGTNKIGWFIPYFQSTNNCDLLEQAFSKSQQQIKQYVYADEYMYGLDEQDEQFVKEE